MSGINRNICATCRDPIVEGECYFVTKGGKMLHPGDCFERGTTKLKWCGLRTTRTKTDSTLSFQQMGKPIAAAGHSTTFEVAGASVEQAKSKKKSGR